MIRTTIPNQYEVRLHRQILKVFHASNMKMHDNHFGNKVYTNYQRVALIVLFMRSKKALRQFVAELKESKWPRWLGLKELPSKSVFHNWLTKWNVSWLRKILNKTVADQKSSLMAIDATGFDSFNRSRHYEKRLRDFGVNNTKISFAKVDLLIDTKNKLVHDFVLRTKPRHDVLGAVTMIKRFKHRNVLILADRGYCGEPLHEIVAKTGNLMLRSSKKFSREKSWWKTSTTMHTWSQVIFLKKYYGKYQLQPENEVQEFAKQTTLYEEARIRMANNNLQLRKAKPNK